MPIVVAVTFAILWVVVIINLAMTVRLVSWTYDMKVVSLRMQQIAETGGTRIGSVAPSFTAFSLDGVTVSEDVISGKEVLMVFTSPHCGVCRQEMPNLVRIADAAADRSHVTVLLISDASPAETRSWIVDIEKTQRIDIRFTVLASPRASSNLTLLYNPGGVTPSYSMLNKDGVFLLTGRMGDEAWKGLTKKWRIRQDLMVKSS